MIARRLGHQGAGRARVAPAALVIQPLVLALLAGSCATPADAPDGGGWRADPLCGARSLLVVCATLGVPADLRELIRLSDADASGATMAGLAKAAQRKGLEAVGAKIALAELADCRAPAICHLWGDHFLVAKPTAKGVRVIDPSREDHNQEVPLDEFKAAYSGFALVLSRPGDPVSLSHVPGPDLRLEAYSCDLGLVAEGVKIERTLTFRNAGETELLISRVESSCPCLEAHVRGNAVPPGARGTIYFTFETEGLRGFQTRLLLVYSNDPVSPLAQIEVRARIRPGKLLVSSRAIAFGRVNRHLGATRELCIKDPGDGTLQVEKTMSHSRWLAASVARVAGAGDTACRFRVAVTLKPGVPPGEFQGGITILSNQLEEPRLRIPVSAKVGGDVEVFPELLFLGFVKKGQTARASAAVRALTAAQLKVKGVHSPFSFLSVEVSSQPGRNGYLLVGTLKDTAPAGIIKGEILVHTNNHRHPRIALPIYAHVLE